MGEHPSLIDANALPAAIFGKLKAQAALANPGFADDTDHATVALDRIRELKFEGGELIVSPDQLRQAPSAAEDVACRGIEQPRQLEHFYRSCDPANGLHAERHDLDKLFGANIGIPGDEDAAHIRHLLHSICEMDVGAGGVIGLVNTVFYRLDDDFAGVEADADLHARICQPRD